MISLILPFLCIAVTSDTVEFDETGNEYIRHRMSSNEVRTYQVSLSSDEYLYMMGSSTVNYELIHVESNTTFESEVDSRSRAYFLLHSENTESICSSYDNCIFHLIVSNPESSSRSIWIRFNKNIVIEPGRTYSNIIHLRKRRRYGMKIQQKDLPILVRLTPNQNYKRMDIDLYGYSEKSFTSYYYPNRAERNHINNYIEQYLISSVDSYYAEGEWHFFEVYGSTDSSFDEMSYDFEVTTNYQYRYVIHYRNNMRIDEPDTLLKKILLIFAFTIATSFILGIFISFFCTFRHQILFCLHIRSTPHRLGASKKEIKKLKVICYQSNDIETKLESTQCIICLEDYCDNDKIRILKCNHNFHEHCSDEWFYLNSKCPLCQQDIVEAKNVHNQDIEMVHLNDDSMDELQVNDHSMDELQLSDTASSVNQSISIAPPTNC